MLPHQEKRKLKSTLPKEKTNENIFFYGESILEKIVSLTKKREEEVSDRGTLRRQGNLRRKGRRK